MSPLSKQENSVIELSDFFKELGDSPYCVVKMSEMFPLYTAGEDVDIFCYSLDETVRKLLSWGDRYVDRGFRIKVTTVVKKAHVHVDFLGAGGLEFRFDLYGELPHYAKTCIKPALFESVIENARPIPVAAGGVTVKVPCQVDDALIRYLEFVEWYDVRPDKLKHLDFIMENLEDTARGKFLDKLHHYTSPPAVSLPKRGDTGLWGSVCGFFRKHPY